MGMKKNEQLIGEIMLDHFPKNVQGALRVMPSVTYPIDDLCSFIGKLETLAKDPHRSLPAEKMEGEL